MKKYIIFPLIIWLLSSCAVRQHESNDKVFNKRKYRKGYHFQGFKTAYKKRSGAESTPNVKIKKEEVELAYRIENNIPFMELPATRSIVEENNPSKPIAFKPEEVLNEEVKAPVELAQIKELPIPTKNIQEQPKIDIKEVEKQEEIALSNVSKKYGLALGLNSIGTSVVSRMGMKAEGDVPWLALIIPTFIFLSGSMLFFANAKRRKEKNNANLEALKANMNESELAAFSAVQANQIGSAGQITKKSVAIHAGLYALFIGAWIYLLY